MTSIGAGAFGGCSGLTSVTIPNSVTNIGIEAFADCSGLTSVTIPSSVTCIETYAFQNCSGLTNVVVSDGVAMIGDRAFVACTNLTGVTIPSSVTSLSITAFDGCGKLLTSWYTTLANAAASGGSSAIAGDVVSHVVTNVVVHYVTQSVPSTAVVPPTTAGIVNVISEVNAGAAVAITADWAAQYPGFVAKFGSDFTKAITAETGKRDGTGKPMMVWQDFVAGTDPTNPDDVFRASITFDAVTGDPIISWTPELSTVEAAKRIYKIFGKVRLSDSGWTLIDGNTTDYNFFKVSVQMK